MGHIVLLGDSIFDNASYVNGGPDVVRQVRERLPAGWQASLRAIDGSVTGNIASQLHDLPTNASILVVSVGGNDALNEIDILSQPVNSTAEALVMLAELGRKFETNYLRMLDSLLSCRLPAALCTIYYPCFPDPALQTLAVTALTVFNDCILRKAITAGLPVIDLRLICTDKSHYANPIEPSAQGGAKIAAAIVNLAQQHDFTAGKTAVFI